MNHYVFAQYFYFVSDDEEAIRETWNHLVTACRAERTLSKESQGTLGSATSPTLLNYCVSDRTHLFLYVLENYNVIEILFASAHRETIPDWEENQKFIQEKSREISTHLESAIGSTSLLIGQGARDPFLSQLRTLFPGEARPTDVVAGTLYRLENTGQEWAHYYALARADESEDRKKLETFLTKNFPATDLFLFRLGRETEYFREQQKTLTAERAEFDKEVSAILHREVVLTKIRPSEIELLETDMGTLSRMYGLLASSRMTVKQAHATLDQDLRRTGRLIEDLLAPEAKDKDLVVHYLPPFKHCLSSLALEDELFEQSLDNAKAAIDVVHTRVALMRSGESLLLQRQTKGLLDQNILLQEEAISLQAAASFIEFILVFFYSLEAWKALAGEKIHEVPVFGQFGLVFAFAFSVVLATHFSAQALRQKKKVSFKLLLAVLLALAVIGLMAGVTYLS
jgi:hypothetical protein